LQRLISGAKQAHALGLQVNAGHGLNYENLPALFRVPHLVELNIGHSIVSRAVMTGLETAVKDMLRVDGKLSQLKLAGFPTPQGPWSLVRPSFLARQS
jgi:pyridoxine 5-phosphate synthase